MFSSAQFYICTPHTQTKLIRFRFGFFDLILIFLQFNFLRVNLSRVNSNIRFSGLPHHIIPTALSLANTLSFSPLSSLVSLSSFKAQSPQSPFLLPTIFIPPFFSKFPLLPSYNKPPILIIFSLLSLSSPPPKSEFPHPLLLLLFLYYYKPISPCDEEQRTNFLYIYLFIIMNPVLNSRSLSLSPSIPFHLQLCIYFWTGT